MAFIINNIIIKHNQHKLILIKEKDRTHNMYFKIGFFSHQNNSSIRKILQKNDQCESVKDKLLIKY